MGVEVKSFGFLYMNHFSKCKLTSIACVLWIFLSIPALPQEFLLRCAGGGITLLDGKETSISLDSEIVKIELGNTTYTVDATFDLFNHAKTRTHKVGFPRYGYGDFKGIDDFTRLEIWVNDEEDSFTEVQGEAKIGGEKASEKILEQHREKEYPAFLEETRWLIKEVEFKGYEKATIRVRYNIHGYQVVSLHVWNYGAQYLHGTGRYWKDNIKKATFIVVDSSNTGKFWDAGFFDIRDAMFGEKFKRNYQIFTNLASNTGNRTQYKILDFEPQANEVFDLDICDETIESMNYFYDGHTKETPEIHENELENLNLWQLRILRNTFFADHGKIFKSPELDGYFRSKPWYEPRDDFKEADLTEIERKNVEKIFKYERRLKTNNQ